MVTQQDHKNDQKKNHNAESTAVRQTPKIISEMLHAAETLSQIGPAVSVFGSARIQPDSPYYAQSLEIGRLLAKSGLAVIAGGGPGIMEAANKGAYEAGGKSVGLNIVLPFETRINPYQTIGISFEFFYSRKATFFMHSMAYVALPGGFGTLDELFEAFTLMQTGKIPPGPIILVGSTFWRGLIEWIREQLLGMGLISAPDMNLFRVVDDPKEVAKILADFYATHQAEANERNRLPT